MLCCNQQSVGLSVLVSGTHLEVHEQIFITVRQLLVCFCVALSLMKGLICNLQLRLGLASTVILRSQSRRTHDHILLSQIWNSSSLEG
jgi:hypothetical protein